MIRIKSIFDSPRSGHIIENISDRDCIDYSRILDILDSLIDMHRSEDDGIADAASILKSRISDHIVKP